MENSKSNASASKSNFDAKLKNIIIDLFDLVVKALIVILVLVTFVFRICVVDGGSMNNTLYHGENLIITNLFYTPQENDIIVFHNTGTLNKPIVKRVIATENRWVKIDYQNCLLYVSDDSMFDESEIVDESSYVYFSTGEYNVPENEPPLITYVPKGYVFVLGDNRNNSTDSRSDSIGLVDVRTILGKAILRITPAEQFGFIK